ncbi:MAG TPA: capsule assembly Wzi family protein [Candidatus Acidoferrales bacterium]|nr:capsule assembly Wzi family protein [Candidatus Acidoferrales bacterium]
MIGRWLMASGIAVMLLAGSPTTSGAQFVAPQGPRDEQAKSERTKPVQSSSSNSAAEAKKDPKDPEKGELIIRPLSDGRFENTLGKAPRHFLLDQKAMWTSPAHLHLSDATWLVPLGGMAAALFATDSDVSRHLNNDPNTLHRYQQFSNYGIAAMAGAGAGLYLMGLAKHDGHERETGFLAGEAAVDSLLATEAIKYATRRERPYVDNANGNFWQGGDSFPSAHATAAWSIAGVIAHEYPGPIPKLAAYGLATAISVSRINGKEHFPSDVLVGSALGFLVANYVYKQHHNPDFVGAPWEIPAVRPERPSHWRAKFMGSPYVPVDSWVYPALVRLAALGYVNTDAEGMRPWTRMECARLVEEAGDQISEDQSGSGEPSQLYNSLAKEFSGEISLLGGGDNRQVNLESVYTRVTDISGQPLTDGYDFGQTITNDYGRPYAEGVDTVSGASAWASAGPFVGYVRAEYQHAPSSPALPNAALQAIAQEQGIPTAPSAVPTPAVDRLDMLDGYVGMQLDNWQITFGKQEQWWGPDSGGSMLFSNNAEPIEMLQINRTTPFTLPGFLGRIGPIRAQYFLGRLGDYHWMYTTTYGYTGSWTQPLSDQPFITGEKISVKPTPNLELGFSTTTLFAGQNIPFTPHKFFQVTFRLGFYGGGFLTPSHPGDSRGEFDFRYRLPGLRNWVTWYGDGFTDDEPSPVWDAFDKSAFNSGLYFPHLPKLPKLDLRVEGVFTDNPNPNPVLQHGFFYSEGTYRSGYTNDGNLIASWIGRQGQGAQAWATYWFTPKSKLQFNYRHQKVSREFVPSGGTVTDGGVRADFWAGSTFSVTGSFQYEKWNFPVLAATPQTDLTTSIQVTFWPKLRGTKRDTSD